MPFGLEPMLLAELESASRRVSATASRSAKAGILAELLRRLEPAEIAPAVAFLSGQLRQGRVGLGGAAIAGARAAPPAMVATLTLAEVDQVFQRIADLSGPGSAGEKARALADLLGRATADEAHFLMRLIVGELRQGALAGLMEEALGVASAIPVDELRRAVMLAGDLGVVAQAALTEGRAGLAEFRLRLFQPVQPMLAQPAEDLEAALRRLGEAALEYKFDGARVQVHKSGAEVRVFSRRLNDVTAAVPELVEVVHALPAREVVLDGEVLALRPDDTPLPFQVTMRRFGRRLDVEPMRRELPLTTYFFDVLRLEGQDLFGAPARERFAALDEAAPGLVVPRRITADPIEASAFLDDALRRGHEGVMAKATAAAYDAGRRGFAWLKIKRAHTLDLVVLAAEWGHGRRAGRLSNIHLGARDPATGAFLMMGKTFKGMTDAMLEWQTRKFQELAVATDGYTVHLRPELVVEVAFNDVQESPQYPAGMALRFARVVRYREDKSPAEADSIDTLRAILAGGTARG
jgi:DNA ligase 1